MIVKINMSLVTQPHVHLDRDDLSAKLWLDPVGLTWNFGFTAVR